METSAKPLTIREIYGMKSRTDGVGIEVEVESKTPLPADIGGVWLVKTDDSLRDNAFEYVCRQPIKVGPDKIGHIKTLTDKLNVANNQLSMSHRTSVHVHRNIQEFTPAQLWTAIIAYWMIEDPLLDYCGEGRKGNLFCLPLSDCDGILTRVMQDLTSDRPFSSFNRENSKYGGQNLSNITTLGSVEYRSMRGTTDPEIIDRWSSMLHHIGEQAKVFGTPDALMDYYLESNKDELLNALLPREFIDVVKASKNYVGLIKENVLRLCDLAYAEDDWLKWELKFKSNTPAPAKKSLLNSLLQAQAMPSDFNLSDLRNLQTQPITATEIRRSWRSVVEDDD
jgi:hypothetical protein